MAEGLLREIRKRTHELRHESTLDVWLARNRERLSGYDRILRTFGEAVRDRESDRFEDLFCDATRFERFVTLAESLDTAVSTTSTREMVHEFCELCCELDTALRPADARFEKLVPPVRQRSRSDQEPRGPVARPEIEQRPRLKPEGPRKQRHPLPSVDTSLLAFFRAYGSLDEPERVASHLEGVRLARPFHGGKTLWERSPLPGELRTFLIPPVLEFFEERVRILRLAPHIMRERAVWSANAPGWARRHPKLDGLLEDSAFPFKIPTMTAWLFPAGLLVVQVDVEPGFLVPEDGAVAAGHLVGSLIRSRNRFRRFFHHERQRTSVASKTAGLDDLEIFSALRGEETTLAALLIDLLPPGFRLVGHKLKPAVLLRTRQRRGPDQFSPADLVDLYRIAGGMSATQALSPQQASDKVMDDGRALVRTCATQRGFACWTENASVRGIQGGRRYSWTLRWLW